MNPSVGAALFEAAHNIINASSDETGRSDDDRGRREGLKALRYVRISNQQHRQNGAQRLIKSMASHITMIKL